MQGCYPRSCSIATLVENFKVKSALAHPTAEIAPLALPAKLPDGPVDLYNPDPAR
jgi:hypothetical protein